MVNGILLFYVLAYQNNVWVYFFGWAALPFLVIGLVLWFNIKKRMYSNLLLSRQKEEIKALHNQLEAKNRDLAIEVALESVRSLSFAMHKSDELADISQELFKQIQSLGVPMWHCAFRIYDEDHDSLTEWSTNVGGVYSRYQIPNEGIFRKYYDAGMAGETLHIEVIGEDRCADHYTWLCILPEVGDRLLALKASGVSFPTSQIDHVAYFKYGYLIFITYEPAFHAHDTFKRFAKVLEQTYTRFLDLQNAEDQAKKMEMKALNAQMNPHFIYNALNSIQALVANGKNSEGIHYIGSFSRLLRRILDNSENSIIGLDKELETVDLYIQLESLRLDMQLQYKKIIAENVITEFEKVPPLILQPFIENALWHGLSRKEGEKEIKVAITLESEWLTCIITDNGIGREKAGEFRKNSTTIHQSKGIDITRQRLGDFNNAGEVVPIEYIDLYDDEKRPVGTKVIVRIKRKPFAT